MTAADGSIPAPAAKGALAHESCQCALVAPPLGEALQPSAWLGLGFVSVIAMTLTAGRPVRPA